MTASAAPRSIVIVGGGASGLLVAVQLLRHGADPSTIAIVEPGDALGQGIAYSTAQGEHLLNVVAARMSAFDDDPSHFVRFLEADPASDAEVAAADAGGGRPRGERFAPRRVYARYLAAIFAAEPGSAAVSHHRDRVLALQPRDGGGHRLSLASGATLEADAVVLAPGNEPRRIAEGARPAWDADALAAVGRDDAVAIIGAGLSMVDAVLTLDARGHRGPVTVLSRHGLAPLAHGDAFPGPAAAHDPALHAASIRQRLHAVRARVRDAAARGEPWQWAIDALRPQVQSLWKATPPRERARFLRHGVRYWDIHRHRIAPQVAARLDALKAAGRLQLLAGRLAGGIAREGDGRARLAIVPRGGGEPRTLVADVVFDATGVEGQLERMRNPLLRALADAGLARAGSLGIGLDCDDAGRVRAADGRVHAGIAAIGGVRIGQLWESIAIPELRGQAREIAALFAAPVAAR